ncbi:MAG: class I SAM-dependent methyltransferase [Oligoflexales bacterium]
MMRGTTSEKRLFEDQKRKQSFDQIASLYDQYRPGYPQGLFDFLIRETNLGPKSVAIEIGCGSGQATIGFADTGASLTCIDISPELLNIARQKFVNYRNIQFLDVSFEDLSVAPQTCDLVFSAQAFHWINFETGIPKCYQFLKAGGCLALIWNSSVLFPPSVRKQLDDLYRTTLNDFRTSEEIEDRSHKVLQERYDQIDKMQLFSKIETHSFTHLVNYSTDAYVGLLQTHSDHSTLPSERLHSLLTGVRKIFDSAGGTVQGEYRTSVILGEKRL